MSDPVQFKDFNFKLAVIQRLMYEQNVLTPRFDVYEFVERYTARHIDIEKEGYGVIPEVRRYFKQLVLGKYTLNINNRSHNQNASGKLIG